MTHDPHRFSAATDKLAYAQAFSRDSRVARDNTVTPRIHTAIARGHDARLPRRALATLLHRH